MPQIDWVFVMLGVLAWFAFLRAVKAREDRRQAIRVKKH